MKKFMLAVLAGAMIFGFAAQAMAEVTIGGDIEIRYAVWQNLDLNNKANEWDTQNFFDQRVLLHVDAKITEGLSAYIELDTENYDWGQRTTALNIPTYLNHRKATAGVSPVLNSLGEVDDIEQDNSIALRQAWINFMVPGMPVGVKIGHQPLALGHGIWLDTHREGSDAILVYSKPIPELLIAGAYVQMSQSASSTPGMGSVGAFGRFFPAGDGAITLSKGSISKDDADAYAILANYTWMENNTVGMNFTYVDDDASLDDFGHASHIRAYNTMLTLDGAVGPVNYKGEFDWLYVNANNFFSPETDYIVGAWAAMLGANMDVADMMNVGLELAYGTGNDGSSDRPNIFYSPGNLVFNAPGSRHDTAYYTPYNSTSYDYAYLYNDKIGQGPLGTGGGFGFGDGFGGIGLANTGYAKLSIGVSPTERMKAGMDVLYLRASEQLVKNQDRWLGVEIDAHMSYDIYDNLKLDLEGGYFLSGDWYEYGDQIPVAFLANPEIAEDPSAATSKLDTDDAWGAEARLTVSF